MNVHRLGFDAPTGLATHVVICRQDQALSVKLLYWEGIQLSGLAHL